MNRRTFLSVAIGGLAGIAGCGGDRGTPTATARTTADPPPTTADPTATMTPTAVTETPQGLAVAIETAPYLVRSFAQDRKQRAIEPDEITPLGDIADPLRSALEAAVEGVFVTETVGEELLAGIDRFRYHGGGYVFEPYFSVNGTPYAFDPTVPEFVASLEMEVEDADPTRTVTHDDVDELAAPAAAFVRTLGAYTTMVPRDAYRISVVPPSVDALLERYDYIRDPGGVGRIVTDRLDPGPPYSIQASPLSAESIWGRPVLQADDLPADLRRFVEAVITSDRRALTYPASRTEYRPDAIPAAYDAHFGPDHGPGSGPYVEIDGTIYALRVTEIRREQIPLSISVETDGPDAFMLRIAPSQAGRKPAIDGPVEVASTWSVPGPLWVMADGDRHRLDQVDVSVLAADMDDSRPVGDVDTVSVPENGALVATYAVPNAVPSGTYRAWGLLRVSWAAAGSDETVPPRPYPFQVVLTTPES